MRITTKKLALAAVLTALALGLSTLEHLFPVSLLVPLPGIKLGLANIVKVFALYQLGAAPALGFGGAGACWVPCSRETPRPYGFPLWAA